MAEILIVYHSQGGNTRRMAEAVAGGVRGMEGSRAILKRAGETTVADLIAADGLALGTPEYFGTLSGMMKDFFDRTFYPAQEKVFRKPYVLFVSAGNDGSGAVKAVERITLGYKFRKVQEPLVAKGEVTEEVLERCRELGAILAGVCDLGNG
jgi:multimeric flavodoxin WrbA